MKIHAKKLVENDWVEGKGLVLQVSHYSTLSLVRFRHEDVLLPPLTPLEVRLEDHGQTE